MTYLLGRFVNVLEVYRGFEIVEGTKADQYIFKSKVEVLGLTKVIKVVKYQKIDDNSKREAIQEAKNWIDSELGPKN